MVNYKTAFGPFCSSVVGLPGVEPGLHDPQPCVIPLYHSPKLCCLVEFLDAVGADLYPLAVHAGPLQVGHTAMFSRRIIMTPE